jgi:hypothetical protein
MKLIYFCVYFILVGSVFAQRPTLQSNLHLILNPNSSIESAQMWAMESFGDRAQSSEVPDLRDQNAKHFKNQDGTYTAFIAAGNLHYWENSRWNTIFHSIESNAAGFRNISNSHKTFYPSYASNALTTVLPDGHQMKEMMAMRMFFEVNGLETNPQVISGSTGNVDFNKLTYPNVYGPGIDLRLTQETTKRKMDYIIANINALGAIPNQASFLVFEEKVELPTGWFAVLEENMILVKDNSGTVKAVYEKPMFKDAPQLDSDGHSHSDEAEGTFALSQTGNFLTIQTKVQLNWLTDPERAFPVVIDPTVNLYPDNSNLWTGRSVAYHADASSYADAPLYVSSVYDNQTNDIIRVGRINANYSYQSWSKFNISSLPNSCINSVNLNYRVQDNTSGASDCLATARLRHLANDPVAAAPATRLTDIRDGDVYEVREFRCYTTGTGWINAPLTANLDELEAAIPSGWFGIGYNTFQGGIHTTCYTGIFGYSTSDRPYLAVNYTPFYQVQFSSLTPTTFCAGQTQNVSVTVTNVGCMPWTSGGSTPDNVNFSWWGSWQAGGLAAGQENNPRLTPFISLAPGASQVVTFSVTAPSTPGSYSIQTDLVRELQCWFRGNSAPTCGPGNIDFIIPITVNAVATVNAGSDNMISCGNNTTLNGAAVNPALTGVPVAQSGTIALNNGNPLRTSWGNSRTQNLYTAAELSAAGLTIGSVLNSIALEVTSAGQNRTTLVIGYKFVPAATNTLTATFQTGFTTVFTGSLDASVGIKTYTFSSPTTEWNGSDNIVFDYCFTQNVIGSTSCTIKALAAASTAKSTQVNADNDNPRCAVTTGTTSTNRPYIIFNYTLPLSLSWSPPTGLSSTTILNPIASPTTTTTYTLTSTFSGCNSTDQVTVTVESPVGDPTVFGNNVWNVYGYNGDNTNLATNNYRGYYIQPDLGSGNHGLNTQVFWSNGNSPSDAGVAMNTGNIWNGCTVDADFHTVVHKRRGFPCSTYYLNMMDWDDETRVYLNGALIWSCAAWSGAGTCPTGNIGMFMLDGDSELEVRNHEQVGGSNVNMQVIAVAPTQLSTNGSTRTCRVSGGNAFIFFLDDNGHFIAAINPQNQDLGYVTMTSYVDATNALIPACDFPTNTDYMTSVMQRHWVIDKTNAAATPVQVGLPFLNTELGSLITASNANSNGLDNVSIIGEVLLSKYHGPNNVNANGLDNCVINGGNGNTTLHNQTGNGVMTDIFTGFESASYTTYTVPDFSEFWLHGSSGSALPVELTALTALCNSTNDEVSVHWSTASEQNSSHYNVERSVDGSAWNLLTTTSAAGNSTLTEAYEVKDYDVRAYETIYYRLQQFDQDGASKQYGPVSVSCKDANSSWEVFPNPAGNEVTILLKGDYTTTESQIRITDINGQEIQVIHNDHQGQLITVDLRSYAPGVYVVRLMNGEQNDQFMRLIKQ